MYTRKNIINMIIKSHDYLNDIKEKKNVIIHYAE